MRFSIAARQFGLTLAVVLAALFILVRPLHGGDVAEYALTTIALAQHATPDIRLDDVAKARRLLPQMDGPYAMLEQGMRENQPKLYAAFTRGRAGKVYAIHFFGYSALAALPYKVLELAGQDPLKCFQVVNLSAIFVLGLALLRLFGSAPRALLGLALFMLSGGLLYFSWSSPECLGAAALLAGLALYASGAPLGGALLAGLAGQQNPTILFFFGCAPLLDLCIGWDAGAGVRANLSRALQRRKVLALGAGLAVFAVPLLFNLWQYGVPNIIAKLFSDATLIGPTRLLSFYFDLNQGMVIGIPGVLAALACWGWRRDPRREGTVLLLCALLTLALALPALAVLNWNSGAQGVMRYAFWAAMPLVFALLWRLRARAHWPLALLAGVGLLQGAAMVSALSYNYVQFSPLATLALRLAPALYHPEPEIFAERAGHHDDYIVPDKTYNYVLDGRLVTTLYNTRQPRIEEQLCGSGGALAADNAFTDSTRGWRYIDGPLRCVSDKAVQQTFQVEQFRAGDAVRLGEGWSAPEMNGGAWNGVWSDGARSRLTLRSPGLQQAGTLTIFGHYIDGNKRTRVRVNGADLGWHALDQLERLPLAPLAPGAALDIELEHEAPQRPATGGDTRHLGLFLREITLRASAP